MHKNYYLELIEGKPQLFAALLRFNGLSRESDPARQDGACAAPGAEQGTEQDARLLPALPPALAPAVGAEVWQALWQHGPARKHLLSCSASPEPFWDFSEPSRALALLDAPILDKLALFFGASLHAQEIARTIQGRDMIQLRESLGQKVHEYALYRGQYQTPWARRLFAHRHNGLPLAQRTLLHGQEALGLLLSTWPAVLQERVPVRLVKAAPVDVPSHPELHRGIWFDMKRVLLKEVAPAWQPCFA